MTGRQDREELLDRARGLGPLVLAHAAQAEQRRRLAPEVIAGLRETGLFRLLLPTSLGGLELDPATLPRWSTNTWSARCITSASRWVETSKVAPAALRASSLPFSMEMPTGSRPLLGSSRMSMRRQSSIEMARASLCFMPLE